MGGFNGKRKRKGPGNHIVYCPCHVGFIIYKSHITQIYHFRIIRPFSCILIMPVYRIPGNFQMRHSHNKLFKKTKSVIRIQTPCKHYIIFRFNPGIAIYIRIYEMR